MNPQPPRPPLFRPEALAAHGPQLLGSIRIAAMPGAGVVSGIALGLVALLVAFSLWGQATRKVQVAGVLLPPGGVVQLTSPQAGRLVQLRVDEGQTVRTGDVLAVVDVSVHSDQGNTATLLGQSLQARRLALEQEARGLIEQARQREQTLRDRLRSLRLDITQAEGELEASLGRQAISRQGLQRDEALAAQGFLSNAQVDARHAELLELHTRERQARRNLEALRREAQGVEAETEAVQLQLATQQAQLGRIRASLAQEGTELASRRLLHLTAASDGTVGAVAVRPGHSLQAGQAVLSLLPTEATGQRRALIGGNDPAATNGAVHAAATTAGAPSALQAQLYAPSRAAGFVAPGQPVWMRLQAFPYQKFGLLPGEVTEVSRTPVQPQDLPAGMAQALMSAAQAQEPLYRITVALHRDSVQAFGQAQPLKAGMILDANVVQERRAIWEWVLEPLLAARKRWQIPSGSLPGPSPGAI